jgi:hypothetical protein
MHSRMIIMVAFISLTHCPNCVLDQRDMSKTNSLMNFTLNLLVPEGCCDLL